MMGLGQISRLKLLTIAFCYLTNAVPGSCQQTESADSHHVTLFVAVSNRENGVEITVFPDELHTELVDNRTYFIPDRRLPPECGAQYFRCQDSSILVETFLPQNGGEINILFIPLEGGMAILSQLFRSEDGRLIEDWHNILVVDNPDCSPTVIYKVGNDTFTVCINFTLQHIAVYEIQLYWNETQIIDRAVFEGPLTQLSITTSYLSNFVLDVSCSAHKVYFADDDTISVMDVLDPRNTTKYLNSRLNVTDPQCYDLAAALPQYQRVHKLILVPVTMSTDAKMLAYFNDRCIIYFDLVYKDWTQRYLYSEYGIPYLCPNNTYKVTFKFFNHTEGNSNSLEFTVAGSTIRNITHNISISSGICFETKNTTYFTWSDPQHNSVFVFDFVSGNHFPISPYECSSMDCPQLLLLKNRYIVLHSDDSVFVIDATHRNEFNLIINASLELSDILAVLSVHNETDHINTTTAFNYLTTTDPFNYSTTPSAPFNFSTTSVPVIHNNTLIVTVTVLLLTILIVVFISIFVVLLIYRIMKKRW